MEHLKEMVAKYPRLQIGLIISSAFFLLILYAYISRVLAGPGHDEAPSEAKTLESRPQSSFATIQETELEKLGINNTSFAGEVLSTDDVQIHPLVEGQLIEMKARIGQYVRKGQVLGRLSIAPNPDLIATLAEKAKSAEKAKLQIGVIDKITNESKQRIETLKTILNRSKDSAIQTIDKQALQNLNLAQGAKQQLTSQKQAKDAIIQSAQAEYDQAQTRVHSELKRAWKAAEKAYLELTPLILGDTDLGSQNVLGERNLNDAFGFFELNSRSNFIYALTDLRNAFKDESKIPEKKIIVFLNATSKLLLGSIPMENISSAKLTNLRGVLTENEKDFYETLKDYKESLGQLAQKQADYEKAKAEQDREIVGLEVGAKNAQSSYEITESLKDAKRIEIETDIEKQKFEYDNQLLELQKEKLLSEAEAEAAEVAYRVFASKIGGQEIMALKTGYISGIYKNLGDHVTPETAVFSITGNVKAKKFVRFKIPADTKFVSVGEEVYIESPNSPFGKTPAKVTGVSLALDSNGFFLADADLNRDANLPVHANVRIVPQTQGKLLVVPRSALGIDQNGKNSIWMIDKDSLVHKKEVSIGRAFGDQIEILEGAALNDQFVVKPSADLVSGSKWQGIAPTVQEHAEEAKAGATEGDGHGHSHDE